MTNSTELYIYTVITMSSLHSHMSSLQSLDLILQHLSHTENFLSFRDVHLLKSGSCSISHHGDKVITPVVCVCVCVCDSVNGYCYTGVSMHLIYKIEHFV